MKHRSILLQIGVATHQRQRGIARFAREHGWHVMAEDRPSPPRGWRGDGALVTLRDDPSLLRYVKRLLRDGVPVVDFSFCHPELQLPRVVGDHAAIGRLAAAHFAENRFSHAAWFSTGWTHVHNLRWEAFRAAWRGEPPARLVWTDAVSPRRFDDWSALVAWLGRHLARLPKPLAVFAYNDFDAVRILNACSDNGFSVPEEIAILGVDDNRLVCENQTVTISSIRHRLERIGYAGAALLERLMDGGAPPAAPIAVPPDGVVVRQSSDVLGVKDAFLRDVLDYIRGHLDRSFGIKGIAAHFGVSASTLARIFATGLNTTVPQEIARQRIARVKLLLANTEKPLAEIAAETGFCHAAHLSNAFRRHTGQSPGAYRAAAAD